MSELTELHKTVVTAPGDTEIRTERIFDAPPELIFECYSDPDLFSQWVGPEGLEMVVEEYDFQVGGNWRYLQRDPEGNEYVFFGEFRKIDPPNRLKQTFNFIMEPQPPAAIDEMDLIPIEGGQTRVVTVTTFEAKEYRDGMLQSGMEQGMDEGYAKLDRLLAERKAG